MSLASTPHIVAHPWSCEALATNANMLTIFPTSSHECSCHPNMQSQPICLVLSDLYKQAWRNPCAPMHCIMLLPCQAMSLYLMHLKSKEKRFRLPSLDSNTSVQFGNVKPMPGLSSYLVFRLCVVFRNLKTNSNLAIRNPEPIRTRFQPTTCSGENFRMAKTLAPATQNW